MNMTDDLTRETHSGLAGGVVNQRVQSFQSLRDGRICRKCNNGWMSKLENATKPVIERFVPPLSQLPHMTEQEVSLLALWAFKTAVVRNAATNYRKVVPDAHYRYLFEERAVPPGVCIDAAICPLHKGLSGLQSQTLLGFLDPRDQSNFQALAAQVYNILLAIGPLLLRVTYFPSLKYELQPNPKAEAKMWRLSPSTGNSEQKTLDPYTDHLEFELDVFFKLRADQPSA